MWTVPQPLPGEPQKPCLHCGIPIPLKPLRSNYCSCVCWNAAQVAKKAAKKAAKNTSDTARTPYYYTGPEARLLERSRHWRDAVKHRGHVCQTCGATDTLEVHHDDGNFKNNDRSNLKTLCRACHLNRHSAMPSTRRQTEPPPDDERIHISGPQEFLTVTQAAYNLGITRGRIHQLIHQNMLPAQLIGHMWFIKEADVEAFRAERRGPGWTKGKARGKAE